MFGLNKLADRDFVIGFVLPVLLACLAFGGLFHDHMPSADLVAKLAEDKSFASLTVVVLAVWTGATVLMALNRLLYRLLEGYSGPFDRDDWRDGMRAERRRQLARLDDLYDRCGFDRPGAPTEEQRAAMRAFASARSKFLQAFPDEGLVMPTLFGNAIRAFENYPNDVYRLDGIAGWTRLIGVLPPSYVSIINDARAEVDFWVNCCCLAAAFVAISVGRVGYDVIAMLAEGSKIVMADVWYAASAALALAVSAFAYRCATERAVDWGGAVKAAFDLYLPALAKQLGYRLPKARGGAGGQDEFWDAMSAMFLVRVPLRSEEWEALPPADAKDAKDAPAGGEADHAGGSDEDGGGDEDDGGGGEGGGEQGVPDAADPPAPADGKAGPRGSGD